MSCLNEALALSASQYAFRFNYRLYPFDCLAVQASAKQFDCHRDSQTCTNPFNLTEGRSSLSGRFVIDKREVSTVPRVPFALECPGNTGSMIDGR